MELREQDVDGLVRVEDGTKKCTPRFFILCLKSKGGHLMKITSIKANYKMQAAPFLEISFLLDVDESWCEDGRCSFDPNSDNYGLIGRLRFYDSKKDLIREWHEKVNLKEKLQYGFLDELIENTIFRKIKALWKQEDELGPYEVSDPIVVWMTRKETFRKVLTGFNSGDMKTFSGKICGENEKGERVKIILDSFRGGCKVYINDNLENEGYIHPRKVINEHYSEKYESKIYQFEKMSFMEALDAYFEPDVKTM